MDEQLIDKIRKHLDKSLLPPMIILDVTNVCNLRCIHCPHAEMQKRPDFKQTHMSWERFRKVIDQIGKSRQPCLLRFCGDGEPLMHPRILEMIEYAKANTGAVINLTTNGQLLNREKAKYLVDIGIDLIDVSIDALTAPVYEKIRRGGRYETLKKNLFELLSLRKPGYTTKVMVSFIEQQENLHETEPFRHYWEPMVDYVMVRSLHSASGMVKQKESVLHNKAKQQNRYPCPHLWKRLTVDFAGNIKFCAHDWEMDPSMILGNVDSRTLQEVWQGIRLKSLREMHLQKKFESDLVCADCTDWASSRWEYGYERLVDKVVFGKPTLLSCLPVLPQEKSGK